MKPCVIKILGATATSFAAVDYNENKVAEGVAECVALRNFGPLERYNFHAADTMKKYNVSAYANEWSNKTVTIECDRALDRMPYAQAGVDVNGGDITLWSYATCAAEIHGKALYVSCLCSVTTRKHVSAFLKEYAPRLSYCDAKRAFQAGRPIDIEPGEFIRDAAA